MSNFTEELLSKKLKKSEETTREFSDPKLAGFLSTAEVSNYQRSVLDCNIECWYHIIKDFTFPTDFCPLTLDDAKLFIEIYETNFKDKELASLNEIEWKKNFTSNQLEKLNDLEKRLEAKIFQNSESFFIKTSSRSAKDSPLSTLKFKKLYLNYLNDLKNQKITENEQIGCLLKAAFQCLRIENASCALETLIKSERIYQDMLLAMEMSPYRFDENLVIRKFFEIEVDMEFRGFVYNGNLNALSQYNFLFYSERLKIHKKFIENLVRCFYDNHVSKRLNESQFSKNFVIDFAVLSSKF
jgi:hypothetical protein